MGRGCPQGSSMKITWSVPVPGARMDSGRGDLVRAAKLIAALRDAGHDVVLVHGASDVNTAAAVSVYRGSVRRMVPTPVALALRDVGRVLHARRHARRVAMAAQRQGAELIVETQVHFSDSGARAARICGLPLLLDDCSPVDEESLMGSGLTSLARAAFARQARAARALTVSSEVLRDRLIRDGLPPAKIHVIPNGVDLALHESAVRTSARAWLRLGAGPVLGFVGSFQPWHRLDLLMDAMQRIADARGLRLLLAGDGPGLQPALAEARRRGVADRVAHVGALPPDQIPLVLAACDIGVLPGSNDYGQPMKLLEYGAAGLPSVAPDLPPVRAVVEHEQTGLLFRPGDAGELVAVLHRLLHDVELRHRLGIAARRRITTDGGWNERARALRWLGEGLLDGGATC